MMMGRVRHLLLVFLAGAVYFTLANPVSAQELDLARAAEAVVRIRACDASGCDRGVGSGVIIDPSGVILTANHVSLSNPADPLSEPLNDFVIEMIDDWRELPEARYRATLAASARGSDLALLQIYWDEREQSSVEAEKLSLPSLRLAGTDEAELGEQLHFLGYPLVGGATINYVDLGLSGFDGEDADLLKVSGGISSGYSGGPALLHRENGFSVLGIVTRQRRVQGEGSTSGQVGLIRSVDELSGFDWRPDARRLWVEDVTISLGDADDSLLAIDLAIRALDYAGDGVLAMAYAYDAADGRPWTNSNDNVPSTIMGQVVLSSKFKMDGFLGQRHITLRSPAEPFLVRPENLAFRVVLWDEAAGRALWRDTEWRYPMLVAETSPEFIWPWSLTAQESWAKPSPTPSAIVELVPTPEPSPTATAPASCRVLVRALRLRSGPGTAYPAKVMLNTASRLTPLARNAATTWIEAKTVAGLRGWIYNTPAYVACDGVAVLPLGDVPRLAPATRAAVPTPASAAGPTSVELRSPSSGTNSRDPITFSWAPNLPLDEGQLFELVFWEPNKGEDHVSSGKAWREAGQSTSVTLDPAAHAPETYAWGIWLGRLNTDDAYERIRYLGGGWTFSVPSSEGAGQKTNGASP